ncbi:MAG: glycosyltransferase [Cyanobacteria bacterium CRU_2_1]|nr:glycosyltransferase [Cyanobacteria bacterium RU_5_0]NJR59197.1 glycosyltransferase [Cyanobacteria bacterium CRU_2_1]
MVRASLVFVTKNEEAGVLSILPQMDLNPFEEVYAIDGHSKDGTCEILNQYGVRVIKQSTPGLGAATLEARLHCNTEAMVFFHPDGNENYKDLPRFIEYLDLGYDMVIASRMIKGAYNEDDEKVLKFRKWANLGFALIANTLFGSRNCHVTDVVQGFRSISCEAFDCLQLDQTNCTIDYQMVIRALKARLKIAEFPTIEGHRIAGATNFASIPTGIAEVKMLLREIQIGNSFLCQPNPQRVKVM